MELARSVIVLKTDATLEEKQRRGRRDRGAGQPRRADHPHNCLAEAPEELKPSIQAGIDCHRPRPAPSGTSAQNVWYGISLGSVLLLAAIGLAITFGVMGVINMAHGEMVMLGAYTTFVVQELIRAFAPGLLD